MYLDDNKKHTVHIYSSICLYFKAVAENFSLLWSSMLHTATTL